MSVEKNKIRFGVLGTDFRGIRNPPTLQPIDFQSNTWHKTSLNTTLNSYLTNLTLRGIDNSWFVRNFLQVIAFSSTLK